MTETELRSLKAIIDEEIKLLEKLSFSKPSFNQKGSQWIGRNVNHLFIRVLLFLQPFKKGDSKATHIKNLGF